MATTKVKKKSRGYGYTYADLSTIHDELEAQGIRYRQRVKVVEGRNYIETQIYEDKQWGEWMLGCEIVLPEAKGQTESQRQGSGITYARRYSLLMNLGWASEDDDGTGQGVKAESPAIQRNPAQSNRKGMDFVEIRERLKSFESVEKLSAEYSTIVEAQKPTEGQLSVLNRIFAERKNQLLKGKEK